MESNLGGGAWSSPALKFPGASFSLIVQCCDHVAGSGRGACFGFSLAYLGRCGSHNFRAWLLHVATPECLLWALSSCSCASHSGLVPAMPLVRYRKVVILGHRSVGELRPSQSGNAPRATAATPEEVRFGRMGAEG